MCKAREREKERMKTEREGKDNGDYIQNDSSKSCFQECKCASYLLKKIENNSFRQDFARVHATNPSIIWNMQIFPATFIRTASDKPMNGAEIQPEGEMRGKEDPT